VNDRTGGWGWRTGGDEGQCDRCAGKEGGEKDWEGGKAEGWVLRLQRIKTLPPRNRGQGFEVQGSILRVKGSGLRLKYEDSEMVHGSWFRVEVEGIRVDGFRVKVEV